MASLGRYDDADRRRRVQRAAALDRLASVEVDQFADSDSGLCPKCGTPMYRLLDESKLSLPIENWNNALKRRMGIVDVPYRVVLLSSYERTQEVVRSGLYGRSQLGDLLLTEHELEVAQHHFLEARPLRCDCDFGSEPEYTEEDLAGFEEALIGVDKPMDAAFAATGVRVRTGFRRRSKAALARRRRPRKGTTPSVDRVVYTVEELVSLRPVNTGKLRLAQPKTRCRVRNRPPWSKRTERSKPEMAYRRIYPAHKPRVGEKKYWYFLRKRGFYYLSVHHPTDGT